MEEKRAKQQNSGHSDPSKPKPPPLYNKHNPAPNGTYATNPGQILVDNKRWLRVYCEPWKFIAAGALVVVGTPLLAYGIILDNFLLLVGIGIVCLALWWLYELLGYGDKERVYIDGDSNPGIVISLNPVLIAVATDLTRGIGEYPVVKIIKLHWKGRPGFELKEGAEVATIARYEWEKNPGDPYWGGFNPHPVQAVADDLDDATPLMNTYMKRSWENLRNLLVHVPKPYKPGLYRIGWKAS